ncbi:PREDICTED: DNA replication licensing factor Mcm7 [Papilio polytes]|uniref:DNA replication licensing factor Mcm7 n=1 Tax=Papilio polytes TaxID=76194 RepID=UPI000675DB80|nr:PREDICTED: DNA replication licensing factor Mcm7 [Papilio polytes]
MAMRDYAADKETIKNFFVDFCETNDEGQKFFKYAEQLTKVAHREQTEFVVELDDLYETNAELAEAVKQNTRRYTNIVSDLVYEMLPDYKHKEVAAKDALDVYIEHRIMLEARNHRMPGEMRDPRNRYPPELIRRFEVYFKDVSNAKSLAVRDVRAEHIGKLVTVRDKDLELAKHIAYVHQHSSQPPSRLRALPMRLVRRYISLTKRKQPVVPRALADYLVSSYVELRREARNARDVTFTSARNLLAILRLSTALARLRLSDVVEKEDVSEAIRLVEMSKQSLQHVEENVQRGISATDRIFAVVRELAGSSSTVKIADVIERCVDKGFKPDQVTHHSIISLHTSSP